MGKRQLDANAFDARGMWPWVKNGVTPKRSPGSWNQGLKPAVVWWYIFFDPYPVQFSGFGTTEADSAFGRLVGKKGADAEIC